MTAVTWDAATIERLREMRAVKGWSSGVIGAELGFSRSAIISKCKRLNIRLPIRDIVRPDVAVCIAQSGGRHGNEQPKPPYVPPPPPVFSEPSAPIPTAALLPHHCRWSDSVDAPWMHCGRTGFPFCPEHRRRAFQPQKRAS